MQHIRNAKILLVDDNRELLQMLRGMLEQKGFVKLFTAETCCGARKAFFQYEPELVILDVNLPDGDGFSLFHDLKAQVDIPVLFLSARDEDCDRLFGLGLDADDYMTKPFLAQELFLRVQAILKRTYRTKIGSPDTLTLGSRCVNFSAACVLTPNGELSLTAKEAVLLKKLYENLGNIVTFDALCETVWGDSYYGYENTLMVHMRHLREKIEENPSQPQWLLTVRGLGYKLCKVPHPRKPEDLL